MGLGASILSPRTKNNFSSQPVNVEQKRPTESIDPQILNWQQSAEQLLKALQLPATRL